MDTTAHPTPLEIANALHEALGNAVDNLADMVAVDNMAGGSIGIADTMECCADIAALRHLTEPDATGQPRILAYL